MAPLSYTLEDAQQMALLYPRTFVRPSASDLEELRPGDLVKLVFVLEKPAPDGCDAERMWVRLSRREGSSWLGELDNTPRHAMGLRCGDPVRFCNRHIASIYGGESLIDESSFAIVSRRALNKRQINRAERDEEPCDPEDSGWQFLYGDEDQAYLDDAKNGAVVSLGEALAFEPRLEAILAEEGAFVYDQEKHCFSRVKSV